MAESTVQSSGVVITYKVPHNGILCVVSGERGDDIARCRLVFFLQPDPVSTHDIMGGDLNVKFLLHQLSDYNVGVLTLSFSGIPRILMTFRWEYCSSSSHLSSKLLILLSRALISQFCLAVIMSNLPVIVLASPHSSCARCSVVNGPVTSCDVIAALSASISMVDWLGGQYGVLSWALPDRVRIV